MNLKKLILILLVLSISFVLVACSNNSSNNNTSSQQVTEIPTDTPVPTTALDYSSEFDKVLASIDKIGDNADLVATYNKAVWAEAGPSSVSYCLKILLTATDADSVSNGDLRVAFHTSDNYILYSYAQKYQKAYKAIADTESVKEGIKSLKSSFGDAHSDAVSALQTYYIKAVSYAEFAMNPSGNLLNYNKNHEEFKKEMSELKANADFSK